MTDAEDEFTIDNLCRDLCSEIGSLVSEIDILTGYVSDFNLNSTDLGHKIDSYDLSKKVDDELADISNSRLRWYDHLFQKIPFVKTYNTKKNTRNILIEELDRLHNYRYPDEFPIKTVEEHRDKLQQRYERLKFIRKTLHDDYGVTEHDKRIDPAVETAESALKMIGKGLDRRKYYSERVDEIITEARDWLNR